MQIYQTKKRPSDFSEGCFVCKMLKNALKQICFGISACQNARAADYICNGTRDFVCHGMSDFCLPWQDRFFVCRGMIDFVCH